MYIQNEERFEMVLKSNELIQRSRFSLTTNQQKIVLYLISKLNYKDTEFKEIEIDIKDFCDVCGIELNSGRRYNEIKNSIKQIADKSMWIEKQNGDETLVRWIEKPTIRKNNGTITLKLDEDLKPYLLNLKERYTEYSLIYTLPMKSKYSIRLYELLKSKHYNKKLKYSINYNLQEFKKSIDAEKYNSFKDFRKRVLEKAIEEINKYTDIIVEYKTIKSGKAINEIEFIIETKENYKRFETAIENERGLIDE